MRKQFKKVISSVLMAAVVLSMDFGINFQSANAADTELHNPVVEMNTCDTVYFGNYWQEDTNGDGVADQKDDKTPIRWRILSRNGNDAYVMADQILDSQPYHEKNESVTWETSTLRKWLNEEFYNTAFTSAEQEAVLEQTLVNEDNEEYGTDGGGDTVDKVYLPALSDIQQKEYGFSENIYFDDQTRASEKTPYAKKEGANIYMSNINRWWLRSSAWYSMGTHYVAGIDFTGRAYMGGGPWDIDDNDVGVRPALHLDLSLPFVRRGASLSVSLKSSTWDVVELGNYRGKPITWRVMSVSGSDVFLFSDEILTDRAYHETEESITWKDSALREWLNGEFYQEAFSVMEKTGIRSCLYTNVDDPQYGTEISQDTRDKITLLARKDVVNLEYGFPAKEYFEHQSRGAGGRWWLRSPGLSSAMFYCPAASVSEVGMVNTFGGLNIENRSNGVRPALHFDLSAYPLKKVGIVTAEAEEEYKKGIPALPILSEKPVITEKPVVTEEPDVTKDPNQSIVSTAKPSNQPSSTSVPADPGKYKSVINYIDLGEVSYFGEEADETDVVPMNAEVTGPGTYHVALDFTQTAQGVGNGITFMDVEVQDLAEYYHPDRYIRLDEIKINGKKVSDQILRRAYTCSDDGKATRVNLYNQWCLEDNAYAIDKDGNPKRKDARSLGNIQEATPYLLEDYIEEKISSIEVTFTYGTVEEISKIDQEPAVSPSLPVQLPTSHPQTSKKPDRTSDVYYTPKPKDTPFPNETLEPNNTPKPEESELPDPSEKPDPSERPGHKNNDDLTDDMSNQDLTVRGLDIATDNVVKKGFLSVPRVQLTWDNNRNCDGYEIWRKEGNKSFVKVDYTDDSDETEWFDTSLKKGYKYTYKVLGYVEEDDGTVSQAKDGNSVFAKIRQTVKSCTYTAKRIGKKLKITFKKAEGTKYQIQVKYGTSKKWKRASGSLKKKIVKKVSPKKLKVRIRTGEKVNGKMKYSKWSKAKTVR